MQILAYFKMFMYTSSYFWCNHAVIVGLDKRLHNHMGPEQLERFKEVSKSKDQSDLQLVNFFCPKSP